MRIAAYRYLQGLLAAVLGLERTVPVEVQVPVAPEPETVEEARYYARMYDNMGDLLEETEERARAMAAEAEDFLRNIEE